MTRTPSVIFTLASTDDGEFITVYAPGRPPLPADQTHANFEKIKDACLRALLGEDVDPNEVADMFDVAATVERKFQRLSDRVAVKGGTITFDGDPVSGPLQEQILSFLDAGEDFGPLVNFYEKLADNPLPGVRDTLYAWIAGQTKDGSSVTITEDGDLVGYKGVHVHEAGGYRPSRTNTSPTIVNDVEIPHGEWTVQNVGDVVEMPRANVSSASHECGVGLHIGTWHYAKTFGPVCLRVRFNPRDVVSAPDGNASWKVRVIRYSVIDVVEGDKDGASADGVVYRVPDVDGGDEDTVDLAFAQGSGGALAVGDEVVDEDGDEGVIAEAEDEDGDVRITYTDKALGSSYMPASTTKRRNGYSGPTSMAAKGRGRNPAQDAKGQFSGGRPDSARDGKTGRFTG